MKKAQQKVTSQEEIDEMSSTSGEKENMPAPKYPLPSLKINGNTGGFFRTTLDDNGDLELNDEGKALLTEVKNPSGVILIVRIMYVQKNDSEDYELFSNEGSKNSVFSIFKKKETKRGFSNTLIFRGTPEQVKKEFAYIKMVQIIYFLMEDTGEIVRLKVKGLGLRNLFKYWKEFTKDHVFQYYTILGEQKIKLTKGTKIANTFTKGKLIADLSVVKDAIDEVKERTDEIVAYHKAREKETDDYQNNVPIEVDAEDEPEPEDEETKMTPQEKVEATNAARKLDKDKEEDIDVKDIPL